MLSSAATAHIRNDALVTAIVFTICAYGMVLLRWYSRIVCRPGHVGWDDYLISIAMVSVKGELRTTADGGSCYPFALLAS
jgi:hypothetical protein